MPIRPENAARYPKDWPAISAAIRERAGHRCEWVENGRRCTACQYAVGRWTRWAGGPWEWRGLEGNRPVATAQDREFFRAGEGLDANGQRWTCAAARAFVARWAWSDDAPTIIVLTVAHLDHQPENCDPANLRAWCQRHHLAYDHDHHQANAQATRRARAGTLELF